MFIFAALQMLEYNEFLLAIVLLITGSLNLAGILWTKKWSTLVILGLNVGLSAITFYQFLLMDTQYLQWMWLILLIYYIYRLRELGKSSGEIQESSASQEVVEV